MFHRAWKGMASSRSDAPLAHSRGARATIIAPAAPSGHGKIVAAGAARRR
jgi:hypothetical protein